MLDPEVERVAQFLATHALLLLGVGILAAAASIVAIVWVTHLAARLGPRVGRRVATVAKRIQRVTPLRRLTSGAHRFVPSAYLVLHLALGFVMAVALAVFATLAEETLTGGEMAGFMSHSRGHCTMSSVQSGTAYSPSCRGLARVRLSRS